MNFGQAGMQRRSAGLVELAILLLTPPIAWAAHLGAVYLAVTIDCELAGWNGSGRAVAALTVLFAVAAIATGWTSLRRWRAARIEPDERRDLDPPEVRPFIYLIGLAGGIIFTAIILLTGFTPVLTVGCG